MTDHEPIVTRTVTITESPAGVTRSWSASVAGGTEWEWRALLKAALADAERASEGPYIDASREHAERRHAFTQPHTVQLVTIPNGYGRNPDLEEGA